MVLCKASRLVRNSYEIRLALFMALQERLQFVLAIRPGTEVEPDLQGHLELQGGHIRESACDEYSVCFSHRYADGTEGACWVLGDQIANRQFLSSLTAQWLRDRLALNSTISATESTDLEKTLRNETIDATNIDGENLRDALSALCRDLRTQGGFVFVQ